MYYILEKPDKFKWRSQKFLIDRTGFSGKKIDLLVLENPIFLKRTKNKNNDIIYTITDKYYEEASKLIN